MLFGRGNSDVRDPAVIQRVVDEVPDHAPQSHAVAEDHCF